MNNMRPIKGRITTALNLIEMQQTAIIPLLYLADKELFLALLLKYSKAYDEQYATALTTIVSASEAKAALYAWRKLNYHTLNDIAEQASKCYFAMQDALAANRADRFARAELTLKTLQKWTYMTEAEETTPITQQHRSKTVQAAIDAYDAITGNDGSLADFLADLLLWAKLKGYDFNKDLTQAKSWNAADKSPIWGFITYEQRDLLTSALVHVADEPIDRSLLIDILKLNGMSIHDPLDYLPTRPSTMPEINLAIAIWISENFTLVDAVDLAKEQAEHAQDD